MKSCCIRLLSLALFAFTALAAVAQSNAFRFVVLSDIHVGKSDTSYQRRYDEMIREITAATPKPLAVFSTGDLTDHGLETEYDNYVNWIVKPLATAGIPHYGIPGNHEIGGDTNHNTLVMWTNKLGAPYQAVTLQNTRFILTCGVPENFTGGYGSKVVPDKPGTKTAGIGQGGFIDAVQLAWIKQALEAPETKAAALTIMMNHFPLWAEDFGGYPIQDVDFHGNPTESGKKIRAWVDLYGVDLYLCGHRHFQAAPVPHRYPSGRTVWHVLSESSVMGGTYKIPDPNAKGGFRTRGGFGYEVYDVADKTVSHFRKTIDSSGYALIGPTNVFTVTTTDK